MSIIIISLLAVRRGKRKIVYYSGHKIQTFFSSVPILHSGHWLVRGLMTRSLLSDVFLAEQDVWQRICMLCSLTWLYELFVGTLLSLTNAYASCGRSTLNCIERLTWVREAEGFSPESAKRSEFRKRSHFKCTVCTDYVELFSSVKRCFASFVFLFFVLFYAAQAKRPKIWPLFWNKVSFFSSVSVVIIIKISVIVWVPIKDSVQQITLDLFLGPTQGRGPSLKGGLRSRKRHFFVCQEI